MHFAKVSISKGLQSSKVVDNLEKRKSSEKTLFNFLFIQKWKESNISNRQGSF